MHAVTTKVLMQETGTVLKLLMWRDWCYFSLLVNIFFSQRQRLVNLLSDEKTGWCHALKTFLTKRRGGVVPSCMLLPQLM